MSPTPPIRPPHAPRRGIALVSAIAVLVVVSLVVGVLVAGSVGELQQSRASVQATQARAAAEAGEAYARAAIGTIAQPQLRAAVDARIEPGIGWLIPQAEWGDTAAALEAILDRDHGALPEGTFSADFAAGATLDYDVRNFRGAVDAADGEQYSAGYTVRATGTVAGAARNVEDQGVLSITIGKVPLSQWLYLVEDGFGSDGFFGPGTVFDGPVHANRNWGFFGDPEFQGLVTATDGGAWFWCSGSDVEFLSAFSRPPCAEPEFRAGANWNAAPIPLPTTSYEQQRGALGLDPYSDSDSDGSVDPPSARDLCERLAQGPPCSDAFTLADGIYLANDGSDVIGGIYVQGDLDLLALAGGTLDLQSFRFRQGGVEVDIVLDYARNETRVIRYGAGPGGSDAIETYRGLPNGMGATSEGSSARPNGQIYVNGSIRDLQGPGRTAPLPSEPADHPPPAAIGPALAPQTQVTVTAENEVRITSDLIYRCDPTQGGNDAYQAANPGCGDPIDTILGVTSTRGLIVVDDSAPADLYLWGAYLATSRDAGVDVEGARSRAPSGFLRFFGSLLQHTDFVRGVYNTRTDRLVAGFQERFDYDDRLQFGALQPPNFPLTDAFVVQQITPIPLSFREDFR